MKYFVSYLDNDREIQQKAVVADCSDEVVEYMKRMGAKTFSIAAGKTLLKKAEEIRENNYHPNIVAVSRLANVEIANDDYKFGGRIRDGKHYFTFDEALEVQEKLKDTGWRLPTRSEWTLICEEFGQKDDGELDDETLYKKLHMEPTGWLNEDGYLNGRTTYGGWWSGTAGSATHGRYLATDTGGVGAQNNYFRGFGFALRLVRDAKENN